MAEVAINRRLIVTDHAVDQYRQRIRPSDPRAGSIRRLIAELVRCGIEAGNTLQKKPPEFVLYGQRNKGLPKGQRFVWCDEEPRVAFIVLRSPGEGDVVKTTLHRVGTA